MPDLPSRHAISRARFFLQKAEQCEIHQRDDFEAYLEASVVFARAVMHRLQTEHKKHREWKPWWKSMEFNPTVVFFRQERDWILKEGPPKIGQIVGGESSKSASDFYYYELPTIRATETVAKHLNSMERLVFEAEELFST